MLGAAAVLLGMWEFSMRHPARATAKFFHGHSPAEAASQKLPGGFLAVDDGLRRLERDVRRAAETPDPTEREKILIAACLSWAQCDPRDALRVARELGLDQVSNGVFETILQKWADKDFSAALAWADHEAAGEQRDLLMTRLAFVRSQTQPDAAAKLVVDQIPPGPAQAEAGIAVLHQWALRDLKSASAWVERFPGDLQDRAHAELAAVARYHVASNRGLR